MNWSFPIGRLFGSELRIHITFFLLLAWIGLAAYDQGGAPAAIFNVSFIAAVFVCVVAHEFGHALMARRFGIRTPDITLLPIGGLARLERMPTKPRQEILVALAGPMVNVVIWGALTLVFGTTTQADLIDQSYDLPSFLARLAAVNLMLALFNLIPAFPMDGGRVLRAVLSIFTPRPRATQLAAGTGQILAVAAGLWAVYSGNLVLALIAVFIFVAAQAEAADAAGKDIARNLRARDAMITRFESLLPSDPMDTAAQTLIRTTQHEFPVLEPDGSLAGFLTRQALFHAIAEGHRMMPVSQAMIREVPIVGLDAPLESVLDALATAPAVAVITRDKRVVGYITRENVGELMVLRARR